MMKAVFTSLMIASGILLSHAQDAQQVEVSPLSLQITYQSQDDEWHKIEPGLKIELLCKTKEEIGISSADSFFSNPPLKVKDGSGKQLGKIRNFRFKESTVNDQEMSCSFEIKGLLPAGNTTVTVEGTLPVLVLEKQTQTEPTAFDVKENTSFKIGKLTFKVKNADAQSMTLAITSEEPVLAPFSLLFTDPDGKEAKLNRSMWSSMGMNGKVNSEITYKLGKKYDKLNVIVDTWDKATEADVPVNLNMGLGATAK